MQTDTLERAAAAPALFDAALENDATAMVEAISTALRDRGGDTFREKVWKIQRLMESLPAEERVEIPVEHGFADGLYMRTIVFPPGTIAVGHVHVKEHVDVMLTGAMTIFVEGGMRRVQAPYVGTTILGGKKIGLAHAETRWLTVHANPDNCQDIPTLEARIAQAGELDQFIAIEVSQCQ